ncbi:hypothetical protein [Helicobacter turcicus]|uniref:Uncharacterized protein n=1 Tax=Helicobacter turcicus TaxID=2867412 RepID=A0ABS7JMK7_9HELI|nr:hypothetical protein [Helicobacter turcicus]MBX7490611.1 hypothetical protein [Helicobacter turcicus]MBX7545481.1 hypothetical protein [Helicobacter turcicus]
MMSINNKINTTKLNLDNLSTLSQKIGGNALKLKERTPQEIEQNKMLDMQKKVDAILSNNHFATTLDENKKHYFSRYFAISPIHNRNDGYIHTTTSLPKEYLYQGLQFNSAGNSKFLDTPIGQMEIFLDLEGDNDKYGVGKVGFMGQLINLDNNRDGYLDADDEFFDKLKLKGYNSSGEEVILKLSDVYGALDLTKFVKTQKEIDNKYVVSGTTLFRPEESYQQMQKEDIKKIFAQYGDKNGYIDFTKTYKSETDKEWEKTYVFWEFMQSSNFAIKDTKLNGETRLERMHFVTDFKSPLAFAENVAKFEKDFKRGFNNNIKMRFDTMYNNYYANDSFANRLNIKREFEVVTGLGFSEAKFKEFYEGLKGVDASKYIDALDGELDYIKGMLLNDDGTITLDFFSGKSINVAELYSTNGEFNLTQKGERASVMSEASSLNEEELNKLDFTQVGMQTDNGIVSLADLGIQFIQKEMFANGKIAFVLTKGNGSTLIASDLYKIRSVENMLLFEELEEKDKLHPRFETEA